MKTASGLGPVKDRVKTDIRLPKALVKHVDAVCEILGVPKNAFFVLAAGKLVVELSPLLSTKAKRSVIVRDVEALFQRVLGVFR